MAWALVFVCGMGTVVAANASGIPYNLWWTVWGGIALVAAPLLVIAASRAKKRGVLAIIVPVPALLAVWLLSIASRCTSLSDIFSGSVGRNSCRPGAAIAEGYVAIGLATCLLVLAAFLLRPLPGGRLLRDLLSSGLRDAQAPGGSGASDDERLAD